MVMFIRRNFSCQPSDYDDDDGVHDQVLREELLLVSEGKVVSDIEF